MITVFLVLERSWEYDDSHYGFHGNRAVADLCFTREEAAARVRARTVEFVRDHWHSIGRFEQAPWGEMPDAALLEVQRSPDAALEVAKQRGLEPYVVQQLVLTDAFVELAELSKGERTALLRRLGAALRPIAPEAADHLESHDE